MTDCEAKMWRVYNLKLFIYTCIFTPMNVLCSVSYHTTTYDYVDLSPYGINAATRTFLIFSVKTCSDAHVGLFTDLPNMSTSAIYEIVIGGWSNSLSKIRKKKQGPGKDLKYGTYLNCNSFAQFWISWKEDTITVGKGQSLGANLLMEWTDPSPYVLNYVAISGWKGVSADWIFENEIYCSNEVSTVNSSGLLTAVSGYYKNDTLTYFCNNTVTDGSLVRLCLNNGTWSGTEPKCEVTCDNDPYIINKTGTLRLISGQSVNDMLTYSCDKASTTENIYRRCQGDGKWSGSEPECGSISFAAELVVCEGKNDNITCVNGIIKIKDASYGRHDTKTCPHSAMSDTSCHSPSSLNKVKALCEGKSECTLRAESSQFGGDPCGGTYKYLKVQYTCESKVITCITEPSAINSSGLLLNVSGNAVNSSLYYGCDKTLISGNLTRICQDNGVWSGEEPNCTEIVCSTVQTAINSSGLLYNISGNTENSTLLYACDKNLISGNLARKCQGDGVWSGEEPNCTEIVCSLEASYINSSGLLSNISGNVENSTLLYHCIGSLKSGNLERQCLANGTWSGEEPNCTDAVCTMEISAINSSGLLISMSGHTENHNLTYNCDGNIISGNLQRRCQEDGIWSGQEPNCTDKCFCKCSITQKTISESEFQQLLKTLETNVKNTSSYKRTKISAEDNRPQSRALGSLGVAILVTVFGLIITLDLLRLYTELKRLLRRLQR